MTIWMTKEFTQATNRSKSVSVLVLSGLLIVWLSRSVLDQFSFLFLFAGNPNQLQPWIEWMNGFHESLISARIGWWQEFVVEPERVGIGIHQTSGTAKAQSFHGVNPHAKCQMQIPNANAKNAKCQMPMPMPNAKCQMPNHNGKADRHKPVRPLWTDLIGQYNAFEI